MGHFGHDHDGHEGHGGHTHQHTHTGEDGQTYTHTHQHTHGGDHNHDHSGVQAVAVLQYMLEHNIHHAKELSDMASQFEGEARHQLLHAYLSGALEELKKQRQ